MSRASRAKVHVHVINQKSIPISDLVNCQHTVVSLETLSKAFNILQMLLVKEDLISDNIGSKKNDIIIINNYNKDISN